MIKYLLKLIKNLDIYNFIYVLINIFFNILIIGNFFNIKIGIIIYSIVLLIIFSFKGEIYYNKIVNNTYIEEKVDLKFYELEELSSYDINLYVSPEIKNIIYSSGKNNIFIGSDLLNNMNKDNLLAIIYHEIGHLKNKDTYFGLVVIAGNLLSFLIYLFLRIIFGIINTFIDISLISNINLSINILFEIAVMILFGLWTKLGISIFDRSHLKRELRADKYSIEKGYGKNLLEILIDNYNNTDNINIKLEIEERIQSIKLQMKNYS